MIAQCEQEADDLGSAVQDRRRALELAEEQLLQRARVTAEQEDDA
jgi:hypothetical protein